MAEVLGGRRNTHYLAFLQFNVMLSPGIDYVLDSSVNCVIILLCGHYYVILSTLENVFKLCFELNMIRESNKYEIIEL